MRSRVEVDQYLAAVERSPVGRAARDHLRRTPASCTPDRSRRTPIACSRGRAIDVAVLVGPSHYLGFEGVAVYERGAFETPFGPIPIAEDCASALAKVSSIVKPHPAAHAREHSLEMQLPFLKRVLPDVSIVPLVMGYQRRETAYELGDAIAALLQRTPCGDRGEHRSVALPERASGGVARQQSDSTGACASTPTG